MGERRGPSGGDGDTGTEQREVAVRGDDHRDAPPGGAKEDGALVVVVRELDTFAIDEAYDP